jgi:hypothetical protein
LPLLGFTKLKSKLLDGTKTQTIRRPRKHPLKVGDKLFVYWKLRTKECEKLGEAIVTKVVRKQLDDINNEDAVKDGFADIVEFQDIFTQMHPKAYWETEFDIITFEWTQKEF